MAAGGKIDFLEEGVVAGVADLDAVEAGADLVPLPFPLGRAARQEVVDPDRRVGDVALDAHADRVVAELRIAGPKGDKLSPNETGPIWVRSRALSTVSVPKIHLPKRGDGTPIGGVEEGWLRTGDLGQQDKTGRTVITGREDDLVKVDGKRVALGEVAGCLESFPKVKEAEVRIVTDDLGGPMVVARIVRAGVCRAEDIIDHCARNLAPYKVPRQIEFCEVI